MDTLILFAEGFIGMFNKGGETLIGWVSSPRSSACSSR